MKLTRIFYVLILLYALAGMLPVMAAPIELNLKDCVRMALQNNPSVKVAAAERDNAKWALKGAVAGFGPTISFTHIDSRLLPSPSTSNPHPIVQNYFDNTVSLLLPLYTGGKLEAKVNQAELNLESSDHSLRRVKQQMRYDATYAYYSVLQARNVLKLEQESVQRLQQHLHNVQKQFAVGTVAKSDVLRSEVELANEEQTLIKAENSYELAICSLNNVIGLPLSSVVSIKEELIYKKANKSLDEILLYARANHPNVLQMLNSAQSAVEGVSIAKSGYLPSVDLEAESNSYDSKFPGEKNYNWSVGVAISWNVFDAGVTEAQLKQAQSSLGKAKEQVQQTLDSTELEVRTAYLNLREAEKRIHTSQVAVTLAEEDYAIAQIRYSAGVGTNLDVLDSQVSLTQAKNNYIQALYDYNTYTAKLELASGCL